MLSWRKSGNDHLCLSPSRTTQNVVDEFWRFFSGSMRCMTSKGWLDLGVDVVTFTSRSGYSGLANGCAVLLWLLICRGVDTGAGVSWPLTICRSGQSMLDPQNVTFFHSKLLLDNSASFTSSRLKDLCQKLKVKLIFQRAWNSLTDPDPPPAHIYDRSKQAGTV